MTKVLQRLLIGQQVLDVGLVAQLVSSQRLQRLGDNGLTRLLCLVDPFPRAGFKVVQEMLDICSLCVAVAQERRQVLAL